MTFIDILILAALLISALFAFRRGFTREAISISAWVATGVGTYYIFPWVAPLARRSLPFGMFADIVALFVVFTGLLMVFTFISSGLAKGLKANKPSMMNRSMGFAFGLVRGLVLAAGTFWILGFTDVNSEPPSYILEANLFPLVDTTAQTLSVFLPQAGALGVQGLAYASDPTYEAPDGAADEDGYADSERRALDQLIESTSGD